MGKDHNVDGRGEGFNVPSLLGIWAVPPYYHNGSCETLACVVGNAQHRTAKGTRPDVLSNPADQAKVIAFLQSLDADTNPISNLYVKSHDLFLEPSAPIAGDPVKPGANLSVFGPQIDFNDADRPGDQGQVHDHQVRVDPRRSTAGKGCAEFHGRFRPAVDLGRHRLHLAERTWSVCA